MFDTITSGSGKGAAARKGSSFAFSVAMHGVAIALAVVFSVVKDKYGSKEEPVTVTFRPAAAPPPPPPPPPPPASRKKKVRPDRPKTPVVPRTPTQIVQPKEVPKVEQKPPESAPVNEDEGPDEDEGVEGGVEGGVVGGVVGGVIGGQLGGQVGGTVGGTGEGPPMLLGGGMSRPYPGGACRPPKPQMPEQARTMGIAGLVLVEFVVHGDGHVDGVVLKNKTAPPILFEAVKRWLEGCQYNPSVMQGTGKTVPVKMIVPFNFSLKG